MKKKLTFAGTALITLALSSIPASACAPQIFSITDPATSQPVYQATGGQRLTVNGYCTPAGTQVLFGYGGAVASQILSYSGTGAWNSISTITFLVPLSYPQIAPVTLQANGLNSPSATFYIVVSNPTVRQYGTSDSNHPCPYKVAYIQSFVPGWPMILLGSLGDKTGNDNGTYVCGSSAFTVGSEGNLQWIYTLSGVEEIPGPTNDHVVSAVYSGATLGLTDVNSGAVYATPALGPPVWNDNTNPTLDLRFYSTLRFLPVGVPDGNYHVTISLIKYYGLPVVVQAPDVAVQY